MQESAKKPVWVSRLKSNPEHVEILMRLLGKIDGSIPLEPTSQNGTFRTAYANYLGGAGGYPSHMEMGVSHEDAAAIRAQEDAKLR